MPERMLKKLNSNILPEWRVCFFASIVAGLFAHLYKITAWLPNWDSLVFRYDSQNMVALGRWFLPVVCSFSSFYDLPFLNGIIAIIFHALGAVCICKIFNVNKKITAFLIGALVATFPAVTSVMMYNYVADGYAIAFFLSTLAALYMIKGKKGYVVSAFLIALTVGIYQAYITVTIMLVLFKLIDEIVYHKEVFKSIFKKALFMLLSGILGVALYGLILKLILAVFSVELLDYQGINETASLSNIDIFASLYVVKETFLKFFFDLSGGINVYVVLNSFIFIVTIYYYFKDTIKNNAANILTVAILGLMLILGAGALAFINANVDYHNLMLMGYAVFYLFFIMLYERGKESVFKSWIVLLVAVILISNQIVTANVSYHKAQMAYEKSYGVLVRIADRIEQTVGSEDCDKILVIGSLKDSEAYSVKLPPDITGITDGYIIRADDETVKQSVLCSALNDYCGKKYKFLSGDEKKKISDTKAVKAMKVWPAKDCIAVVDNTIIIKLGTEGEN